MPAGIAAKATPKVAQIVPTNLPCTVTGEMSPGERVWRRRKGVGCCNGVTLTDTHTLSLLVLAHTVANSSHGDDGPPHCFYLWRKVYSVMRWSKYGMRREQLSKYFFYSCIYILLEKIKTTTTTTQEISLYAPVGGNLPEWRISARTCASRSEQAMRQCNRLSLSSVRLWSRPTHLEWICIASLAHSSRNSTWPSQREPTRQSGWRRRAQARCVCA